MELEWYLKVADKEVGPLSAGQLKAMADRGQIKPGDPVRRGSDGRWVAAGAVKGLLPAEASSADAAPAPATPDGKKPDSPPARSPKKPVAQPAAPASGQLPVTQPVPARRDTASSSKRSSAGIQIDAGDDTLVSRYGGRRGAAAGEPKTKRRKNDRIVIALAVTLVGLIVVGGALVLSRTGAGGGGEKTEAEAGDARRDEKPTGEDGEEDREVIIPGLADYLGEPEPEASAEAEPESSADAWTDASTSSAECGDVRVKIAAAEVGRPRLIRRGSQRGARPKTEYLSLKLELFNNDQTKKLDYTSWNLTRTGVRLVDEHDNEYAMKSFAAQGLEIDGQVEGGKGSLYPQETTQDMLVFEKPAKRAERLRLELPAIAFGQSGSLKFEILASMIAVAEEPAQASSPAGAAPGERAPGREVPAISRAIAELDTKDGSATGDEPPAAAGEKPPEDGIPIPGVTGEESEGEEAGESFSDDPKFQKAYEELRRQQQKEEGQADEPRRGRRRRKP
jgi:hypothetical protein